MTETGPGNPPEQAPEQHEHKEEHAINSPETIPERRQFSYYRDDNEDTGGMKVKWVIRVAEGAEAGRLDTRQSEAIKELLAWARRHPR